MEIRIGGKTFIEREQEKTEGQLDAYAPNYVHWAMQDLWKLDEAAALIVGIEPHKINACTDTLKKSANNFLNTATTSERSGRLYTVIPTRVSNSLVLYASVHPYTIINFATDKGFDLPDKLIAVRDRLVKPESQSIKTHPYLDKGNKYYAKELAIAVHAWIEIFGSGDFQENKTSPKTQINTWLSNNHSDLSKTARDRITTLINPMKLGGAPKSQ